VIGIVGETFDWNWWNWNRWKQREEMCEKWLHLL